MIYDCFPFFNELDLLEIRLHELNAVVDKFVLVEATRNFQQKPKPLFFAENKQRFAPFLPKITHIIVDKYPTFWAKLRKPTTWDYSNHQKGQIIQGLRQCQPEDVIIISDIDEIPKASKIAKFAHAEGVKVFEQRFYNYYFNCICTYFENQHGKDHVAQVNKNGLSFWRGSVMLHYKNFKNVKQTRLLRDKQDHNTIIIEEGGWHFSFLGGIDKVLEKLNAWEHTEQSYAQAQQKKQEELADIINKGKDLFGRNVTFAFVPIDSSYPEYLLQNTAKFEKYIKNN